MFRFQIFAGIVLSIFIWSCGGQKPSKPILGKYINMQDGSYLYILHDNNYKRVTGQKKSITGKWIYIEPNNIGFKDWVNEEQGRLNYQYGIIIGNKIVFDPDNDKNNYFLIK